MSEELKFLTQQLRHERDEKDREIARLRKALRLIINRYDGREDDALVMKGIAREALGDG